GAEAMKGFQSLRSPGYASRPKQVANVINRIVENDLIDRVCTDVYLDKIKYVYSGQQWALLATASKLSIHIQLGRRLFRTRQFELGGMKSILDVGSGAGQVAQHLLEFADADAQIYCTDLSHRMLCRARQRLHSDRPAYVAA